MSSVEQKWIDINLELRLKLKELEVLEKERKQLLNKDFDENTKKTMNESIEKYSRLLIEIKNLKDKANTLSKSEDY